MLQQVPGLIVLPETQKKENDKMNVPTSIHGRLYVHGTHLRPQNCEKRKARTCCVWVASKKHIKKTFLEKKKENISLPLSVLRDHFVFWEYDLILLCTIEHFTF